MIKSLKNKWIVALLLISALVPSASIYAQDFHLSLHSINSENIRPGTNFIYVVEAKVNELKQEKNINLRFNGDQELEKWIYFPDQVSINPKKNKETFYVQLSVPKRVEIQTYSGDLIFYSDDPSNIDGKISMNLKLAQEPILDYQVKDLKLGSVEQGSPLFLNFKIKNLGNTDLNRIQGKFEIFNQLNDKVYQSKSWLNFSESIPAYLTKNSIASLDLPPLEIGTYQIHLELFSSDQLIFSNKNSFQVKPATHLFKANLSDLIFKDSSATIFLTILLTLLLGSLFCFKFKSES